MNEKFVYFEIGYLFNNPKPTKEEIRSHTQITCRYFLDSFFEVFSKTPVENLSGYDCLFIRKRKEHLNDYVFQFYPRRSYSHQQFELERDYLDQVEVILRKKLQLDEKKKGLIHTEPLVNPD